MIEDDNFVKLSDVITVLVNKGYLKVDDVDDSPSGDLLTALNAISSDTCDLDEMLTDLEQSFFNAAKHQGW